MKNIVMVCVGNICRSPMAEGLLRHLSEQNSLGLNVSSAGLSAMLGHQADSKAIETMQKRGIDISQHQPRQINPEILLTADLILVMESWQQKELGCIFPSSYGKVHRLGKWDNFEISDPYRKPIEQFEEAFRLIEQGLLSWQKKLWS